MEAVASGLWALASEHERGGNPGASIKSLESLIQTTTTTSLLPTLEITTRLRLAELLLLHTHNLTRAQAHLERAHLLLKSVPSSLDLRCRAHSLLARCYHLVGAIHAQKLVLHRGLDIVKGFCCCCCCASEEEEEKARGARLWGCGFYSQLAGAAVVDGDYGAALDALEKGGDVALQLRYPELQMYFATMVLHVHLLQWKEVDLVKKAAQTCSEVWETIQPDKRRRQQCVGLFFYNEMLHTFYLLRICDYRGVGERVDKLDAAMKKDMELRQQIEDLTSEYRALRKSLSRKDLHGEESSALRCKSDQLQKQLKDITKSLLPFDKGVDRPFDGIALNAWKDKLYLAPSPINGEWIPKSAVYALVDLMAVMLGRPKGWFKDCGKRIQSGLVVIGEELEKLGIRNGATEGDLKKSAIWTAGLYLTLLMQFLENKIAIELTRSEFVEAREALLQMIDWYARFPTMLQGCECIIEMLRGQYAHSLGCLNEAVFHFTEATKLTESKATQTMCQVYAAVSHMCIGDAESSSQALDLIGPIYRIMDTFTGVREKTCIIFVYGLLLMKQHNLQESRVRLASGLKIAHQHLGNIQLVSQFLTILGTLALQLHDTGQAKEILKSALTLAKTLYDIPTQIWVLSVLTDLYKETGDRGYEMENAEYERKKEDDLQKRLSEAQSSVHHLNLIDKSRVKVVQFRAGGAQKVTGGESIKADLDIPESVNLPTIQKGAPVSRLRDVDSIKQGKKKIKHNPGRHL